MEDQQNLVWIIKIHNIPGIELVKQKLYEFLNEKAHGVLGDILHFEMIPAKNDGDKFVAFLSYAMIQSNVLAIRIFDGVLFEGFELMFEPYKMAKYSNEDNDDCLLIQPCGSNSIQNGCSCIQMESKLEKQTQTDTYETRIDFNELSNSANTALVSEADEQYPIQKLSYFGYICKYMHVTFHFLVVILVMCLFLL